jgi:hypothetical protein
MDPAQLGRRHVDLRGSLDFLCQLCRADLAEAAK